MKARGSFGIIRSSMIPWELCQLRKTLSMMKPNYSVMVMAVVMIHIGLKTMYRAQYGTFDLHIDSEHQRLNVNV
jgi:hypothetical protein